MPPSFDGPRAKALLRLAAQRLAQTRDRTDAAGQVIGRDIGTLLGQRALLLARAKATKLIQDEMMADLLEQLENYLGVLSERLAELDSRSPGPAVVEAAASIIYAQSYIDSKDLAAVRDLLAVCLGPDFLQSAATNKDGWVSKLVVRALAAPTPSAKSLDAYLLNIAKTYGVQWEPELREEDVLRALSEVLDVDAAPVVDLHRLRKLCAHGIPSSPAWLRPRTWRLLLGTLPTVKSAWATEATKSRANYYELVRRLLEPFSQLGPPTDPPTGLDAALASAVKDLFRVPHALFAGLDAAPDPAPDCPLDAAAPPEIRIPFASVLDARLDAMHTPPSSDTPAISVTSEDGDVDRPTARAFSTGGAHPAHAAALLRLLYVHSALNPAKRAPHLASLLLPLYGALLREVEPAELAHAEADAFWAFEALVGDCAELEDEEGGAQWMARLGARVEWADADLAADLRAKGLSPALPHYAYRWLAPLLAHTLPLPALLAAWDALFARPPTTRAAAPKLDFLLDICTAMLLRARAPIARLGKAGRKAPGLWGEESALAPPPSPTRAWELNDAFVEGMALLQAYPIAAAGGIESILQTAGDLAARRETEARAAAAPPATGSLAARVRDTVWRGFTNQNASPGGSDEEEEEEEEEEGESTQDEGTSTEPAPPARAAGVGASLATSLWKGITNRSAMEPPPTPSPPPTPGPAPTSSAPTSPAPAASLWGYAEKLRDSDTAAALAKASTNWRAKAWSGWGAARAGPATPEAKSPPQQQQQHLDPHRRSESFAPGTGERAAADAARRGSLPARDPADAYSPPARPAYFRPPRDSWMPQPRRGMSIAEPVPGDGGSEAGDGDAASEAGSARSSLRESIASLAALAAPVTAAVGGAKPPATPKSGPRPLLLSAGTSLLSSTSPGPSRAPSRGPSRSPVPGRDRFDTMPPLPVHGRQDSMASVSSLALGSASARLSDAESDAAGGGSRVVRLNRKSMSPMALAARHARMGSLNVGVGPGAGVFPASPTGSSVAALSPASSSGLARGWRAPPDSPGTLASSPPPRTPPALAYLQDEPDADAQAEGEGAEVLREPAAADVRVLEPPPARRLTRKKTPPPPPPETMMSEDSDAGNGAGRSPRGARTKRPAHLRIDKDATVRGARGGAGSPGATLALPAWDEPEGAGAAATPRAAAFPSGGGADEDAEAGGAREPRRRKTSGGGGEARVRKVSAGGMRTRKVSGGEGGRARKVSDARTVTAAPESESAAEMGDDEGYDDLLSAYESEEGAELR